MQPCVGLLKILHSPIVGNARGDLCRPHFVEGAKDKTSALVSRRNSQQDNNNNKYPDHVPDGGDPIQNGGHPVPKCVQDAMAKQDACKVRRHFSA